MTYPKTILTYHLPSQAEVDKSLLESHGIDVNLLNAHTTRNELGAPFYIQLQVPADRVEEAVAIIRQFNPERFGSEENVKRIEREVGRSLLGMAALTLGCGAIVYAVTPGETPIARIPTAFGWGLLIALAVRGVIGLIARRR